MVVSQHELIAVGQSNIALAEKYILLAADFVNVNRREQCRLGCCRSSADVWHIHYLRHVRALTIISKEEESAILRDGTAKASTKLVYLKWSALIWKSGFELVRLGNWII